MTLTEDEALVIAYNVLKKLRKYEYEFKEYNQDGYSYVLIFTYNQYGEEKHVKFYFGDEKSVVTEGGAEIDLTSFVEKLLPSVRNVDLQ